MGYETDAVFRAVIRNADGSVSHVVGPYYHRGPATAAVNRETGSPWGQRDGWTGAVETADTSWRDTAAALAPAPQTPLHSFEEWPKTPRLFRDITVTEKIDGTNAAIAIRPIPAGAVINDPVPVAFAADGTRLAVFAQSRKRIVTPHADNYGFARWVWDNASELASLLGPGIHYGEWWGSGIQRRYGYANGDRRFSLFNTDKGAGIAQCVGGVPVDAVPVLYRGPFDTAKVDECLRSLAAYGSVAAPGFTNPEGVCVFHHASRKVFKATLDANDAGKWEVATP
jgi:RNA ligase.